MGPATGVPPSGTPAAWTGGARDATGRMSAPYAGSVPTCGGVAAAKFGGTGPDTAIGTGWMTGAAAGALAAGTAGVSM
ncbi:hypothetical protein MAUB1S_03007 [Mycolicibacterium aubagnense]